MKNFRLISKKKIKYICCMTLVFICGLSLKVQATEDSDILSSAKVYTAMSDDSNVTANLIAGNTFEILGVESDADGVVWYQVQTGFGAEGYVKANELDRVMMETQQIQQQEQPQDSTPNEGAESDEDSGNGQGGEGGAEAVGGDNKNPEPNGEYGNRNRESLGELVVLESVNLRRMPSTDSEIISRINLNTKLSYFEQYTNDAGEIWYQVQYENLTGYVTGRAVTLTQQESHPDEEAQLREESVEQNTSAEEPIQEDKTSQDEQQLESETSSAVTQAEFEVDEKLDMQKKHLRIRIDWVIVILVFGGVLCIAAIVILVKKILKLLRK